MNKVLVSAILVFLLIPQCAPACTGFALKDGNRVLVGFSYDQQFGAGHIYVNQRNMERRRYLLYAEKPVSWVSRFGSITFNLAGRDQPHDGMNEAGLVVLSMGLDDTRFPAPDARPAIDELGWIQYQLDTAASVEDVVQSMKSIRISSRSIGDSHFLIVDSVGKAAVIEYRGGQANVYTGDALPYVVLANDNYPHMLARLKQQRAFGGDKEEEYRVGSSCSRFARVASSALRYSPENAPATEYVWGILNEVRQSNSRYQVVYDTENRSMQYRDFNSTDVKTIAFRQVDFDCASPTQMTEIQSAYAGTMKGRFYSYDSNRSREALVEFNRKVIGYLPDEALQALAETPALSSCHSSETHLPVAGTPKWASKHAPDKALMVSLAGPSESSIVVPDGAANVILNLQVKLNRPAPENIDVVLEVPYDSGLTPGDNVIIAPNPVRIEKNSASADTKVIIIADHLKTGALARLIVNLPSDTAAPAGKRQFVIDVMRTLPASKPQPGASAQ